MRNYLRRRVEARLFSDKSLYEHLGAGPFVFLGWKLRN